MSIPTNQNFVPQTTWQKFGFHVDQFNKKIRSNTALKVSCLAALYLGISIPLINIPILLSLKARQTYKTAQNLAISETPLSPSINDEITRLKEEIEQLIRRIKAYEAEKRQNQIKLAALTTKYGSLNLLYDRLSQDCAALTELIDKEKMYNIYLRERIRSLSDLVVEYSSELQQQSLPFTFYKDDVGT